MTTNEVERLNGLSKQTILYYEREGLLQVLRKSNGYRDYTKDNYLEAIALLDDDAKWLAHILKEKVTNIKDECHVLQAFEEEINLNEFLKGKKLPLRSYV